MVNKKGKKLGSLSSTRPPTVKAGRIGLSAKATRTLIRSHHQLLKARVQAERAGDLARMSSIDAQIAANGGLESYQTASKLGQSLERGGDSSKILIQWIKQPLLDWELANKAAADGKKSADSAFPKLRVLEVGALSTKNACSRSPALEVSRIDLNSQEPGILKQDFMERPLPTRPEEKFHVISLSLVLNYVPDAQSRGEMLKRCVQFLTTENCTSTGTTDSAAAATSLPPSLFLVLPLPCVDNSRYLTEKRLKEILESLGFKLDSSKKTSKLIYQLWHYTGDGKAKSFKKEMLNPGHTRNNFSIILNKG